MDKYCVAKLSDYNINLSKKPETYKTILKCKLSNNTETTKLRKKLSKLVKDGFITNIPIKNPFRGKEIIFYTLQKDYYILLANNDCYYCKNIKYDKTHLFTENLYKLNNFEWDKVKNKKFNFSEVTICL